MFIFVLKPNAMTYDEINEQGELAIKNDNGTVSDMYYKRRTLT